MTGRPTDTEQYVSQWNTTDSVLDPATGALTQRVRRARLDVVFTDAEGRRSFVDVAVVAASSESSRLRGQRSAKDGCAAADAVRGKHSKYPADKLPGCPLVPFVVESLGRLSTPAHDLLRSVAPEDQASRSRVLASALQTLSVLVQTRLAEQLLSAEANRRIGR